MHTASANAYASSTPAHSTADDAGTAMASALQAGRQAGRHDWFYYTSTKCAIPDDMALQVVFDLVFQQMSTADHMTCSMAQISVPLAERAVASNAIHRQVSCSYTHTRAHSMPASCKRSVLWVYVFV